MTCRMPELPRQMTRLDAGHKFQEMRVALVSDDLTRTCLSRECGLHHPTPIGGGLSFWLRKPAFLLVESAWEGHQGAWKYKIAAYPDHPRRSNASLQKLVARARSRGIPTVFWNHEDGVHFDRFIGSARLFDHVFTVDANCVPRYKAVMGEGASVHTLMFPVQPAMHSFTGFNFRHRRANFVGSYGQHVHDGRRQWQDAVFGAALASGLGLTVFDRNSGRKAGHYRYPALPGLAVRPAVPHAHTAQIYKDHLVSLNVNTVDDSPTMYSRRLVEILACGGIAVTSPAPSVDAMFKDYCHVVRTADEARPLFERWHRDGPSAQDLERARAGADYVLREHTWARRLAQIAQVVGL